MVCWDSKVYYSVSSPFLLIIIRFGCLVEIKWSICMSKSHRSFCISFSRTDVGLCIYHLFVGSNLNFLHSSQWITLPTQSCLVLYSFCTNLLHLLIMWLIVSSLTPHNLHLLCCSILSILALIWLILIALFCAAIRRDSVSLFKFFFFFHVHVFLCEMLLISCLKCPYSWVFFPFLFSGYCHSVGPHVISIISGGCNQSSSTLLNVVFQSLYRCVNTVFNAGKSSSSFFPWHI